MLENKPSQSIMTELLGQSLYEVWQALCTAINKKYDMEQTLRFATAISAATAESESSVGFNLQRAQELMPMVTIKKI